MGFRGLRDVGVHHAGLDERAAVANIEVENAVHPRERNHHPAGAGQDGAAQARARAAWDDGQLVLRAEFHDGGDFRRRARQHYDAGQVLLQRVSVTLVNEQLMPVREDVLRADERAQLCDDGVRNDDG